MTYFDHNATHPLLPAARDAWLAAVEQYPANASSPHRLGGRSERALAEAREQLAEVLGCGDDAVVWTSGATESNNMAIAHLATESTGEALVSAIEHPCALEATRRYFHGRHRELAVDASGVVDLNVLTEALAGGNVACVIVIAANNETGVLQPWTEIARICRERGIPYLCDATQWIGRLSASGLGEVEFVSGCAHKFGGPAGIGFLKCPPTTRALLVGGRQEEGRRAGTENVAGVVAAMAALEHCVASMRDEAAMAARLEAKGRFEAELVRRLPGTHIVGGEASRLWNTTSAIMPEARDCRQRWVVKLDKLGFAVSTGSACASGKEESSHVLRAMGYSGAEAGRALRFSAGWNTDLKQWEALLEALVEAGEQLGSI